MNFSLMGFIAGRAIAERENVPSDQLNRVALIGGVTGLSAVGLLVTREIAAREAARTAGAAQPVAPPPTQATNPPPGPAPMPVAEPSLYVPDFVGLTLAEAVDLAAEHGLTICVEVPNGAGSAEIVIAQDPEPGKRLPRHGRVMLSMGVPAPAPAAALEPVAGEGQGTVGNGKLGPGMAGPGA